MDEQRQEWRDKRPVRAIRLLGLLVLMALAVGYMADTLGLYDVGLDESR